MVSAKISHCLVYRQSFKVCGKLVTARL